MNLVKKYNGLSPAIKASFWFMICSIFQKGISFITTPIFARIMTTEEYGEYSFFLSWESIIMVFVTLNLSYQVFNNGMVKYKDDKDGYAISMVGLTLITSFISFVFYMFFYKIWDNFSGLGFAMMSIMFVNMLFVSILGIWTVRERYDYKYKKLTIITLASALMNPLLGAVFVYFSKNKVLARLISLIIVNVLFGCIAFLFMLVKSRKICCLKYWKYALKIDLPLIPHYLSLVLLNNSDRVMIGNLIGNTEVALYSMAFNIAMVMQIVLSSVNSSFIPWTYQKIQNKEYDEIRKTTTIITIFIGLITILPMFIGPEIIYIMGSKKYADAAYLIPILSSGVFLIYIYTLFLNVEMFFEKSYMATIGSIMASVINILLNFFLIKKYGYKAAAYTTLVSYIILTIFHYASMKKVCNEKKLKKDIYNNKFLFLLSLSVICISIIVQFMYNYYVIRYILLFISLILLCMNFKKIFRYIMNL